MSISHAAVNTVLTVVTRLLQHTRVCVCVCEGVTGWRRPSYSTSLPDLLLLHISSKPMNTPRPFPVTSFAIHASSHPTDDTASLNKPSTSATSVCHALIMKKQSIRLRSQQCLHTTVYLLRTTLICRSPLLES